MTEPDLFPNHWAGTKEEYFKLYDYAVDAVTRVIPDADIGPGNILNPSDYSGDAAPPSRWGMEIVDHAATGTNYCTGRQGTRLRFLSCSWYGRVGCSIDSFEVAIRKMRSRLDRYPQFQGLPVEVAEFSVLQDESGQRLWGGENSEWGASWFAAIAESVYRLNVAQVHQWGTTTMGLFHPQTHVFGMLDRMSDGQRLAVEVSGTSAARCGAIACRKDGRILALVYHHRPFRYPTVQEQITMTIRDRRMSEGDEWHLSEWRIDAEHSSFFQAFCRDCAAAGIAPGMNAPLFGKDSDDKSAAARVALFRKNYKKYKELAQLARTETDTPVTVGDNHLTTQLNMDSHSVRLLELTPSSDDNGGA